MINEAITPLGDGILVSVLASICDSSRRRAAL
jgi:hypothetical protein